MKKQFFNKVTSILLVFVMVLALVPMAIPAVYAEEADVVLSADTLVIDSVADWKAVAGASASTDFAGKVVKLGGNIAFGEEAAPVLFSGTFAGTFYGNGYTVSGTTLAGANLIATTASGTIDGGDGVEGSNKVMTITGFTITASANNTALVAGTLTGTANVKNFTVSNCSVTASKSTVAYVVASVNQATTNDDPVNNFDSICATISNCTVIDCVATYTHQSAMILAAVNNNSYAKVVNCKVLESENGTTKLTATGGAAAGMIVGKMNASSYTKIIGCETAEGVELDVKNTQTGYAIGAGMIAGCLKENVVTDSSGNTVKGMLSVYDCIAKGTIVSKATNTGGIVGSIVASVPCEIKNCTVDVNISTTRGGDAIIGGVIGAWYPGEAASLTVSECNVQTSITATGTNGGGSPRFGGILGAAPSGFTSATENKIENCYVDADITVAHQYGRAGGIIGDWGVSSATLNISDCYYTGALSANKTGGVSARCKNSTLNVNNVIIASDVANVGNKEEDGIITFTKCYTTNGDASKAGFVTVSDKFVNSLITMNGNKIADVKAYEDCNKCNLVQVAKQADGKYSIRFIATSLFDGKVVTAASMTAAVGDTVFPVNESTILEELEAYGENGAMTKITSEEYGADMFCAIVIDNVPAENLENVEFTITFKMTVGGVDCKTDFTGFIPAEALV